ncbi:MAG: T9SS type A sorting domain-containing protein [Bacteroidetes bacterium]|nr:MAG: T9SS type A sorting domain-containing protein [Bacteroidota bacterium]
MKKIAVTLFLAIFLYHTVSTQEQPTPIYSASDAPAWMHLMQAESPNVFQIEKAYRDYFKERPFEKNSYTQYYKRWMAWSRPFTQADGSLAFPTPKEENLRQVEIQARRKVAAENGATNWSWVGPSSTYHTDGITKVTWQTNIYAVDIAPSDPNVLYAGGESGGLWKTTDKGLNWTLLTADLIHNAFGAVRTHPTDPNTVYAATRGKVLKSTDGGASWLEVYVENNLRVNEMAIHPTDPDIILAAADQGFLVSTDGGQNWSKVFTNKTWAVKFKPGDAAVAYAIRQNGSSSDFLKSTDNGLNWTPVGTGWWTPGADESVTGAHIAVCPSNPDKLYTYLCGSGPTLNGYIGVFVSPDNGASWANTNPSNAIGEPYSIPGHTNLMANNGTTGFNQGFYDMAIIVDPNNDQQLIAGGTSWFRSADGGQTWQTLGGYVSGLPFSHPDLQALAVHGNDLWIASDGGLNYSTDFGLTHEARMDGITGANMWGFDSGWNDDLLVGGRYHNGNMAWHESFPDNTYYRMGGGEAATGYVNPGPGLKTYHSDIGGYSLNGGLTGGRRSFPVGLFPNESYAYYANSEMVWHPQCWGIVFLGKDNIIWKSMDGGASFTALYTFPGIEDNKVFDIEVARSDPKIMYCSQWDGVDDSIWRSTDGGQTWTKCTGLPLPNNNDRVKLAVSGENANVLWCAVTYGSNGKKIYKSIDGGQSWENLTTAQLNGVRISNIMAQYGTDGGIYLGTNQGVFYRNNSHTEWQPYSNGLPLSAETNRLKPFYRDGKIRNGCWGFGVWEAPLFEPSGVLPQAMADKLESSCARDTFYFDDYSVVRHDGVSWAWSFPGAAHVQDANTRQPKVVFGSTGQYQAYMALTTPQGVFHDTLLLTVGDGCDRDSFPGQALLLDGDGDYAVAAEPLYLNSDSVTITAWIKWLGPQSNRAAIVFCRGGNTTAGIGFDGDRLSYHWNGTGWWWNSGLTIPQNEWVHLALVAEPTRITVYLNGVPSVDNTARGAEEFDAPIVLGVDPNGGGRYFNGLIDEVCIYQRALDQAEIREQMHLVRLGTDDPGLKAYYQFNEPAGSAILDRSGTRHLGLNGDARRQPSGLAVGPGASKRLTVTAPGTYYFGKSVGFEFTTSNSGLLPDGEVCVSRLNLTPDATPDLDPSSRSYWVVHNYGANTGFASLREVRCYRVGRSPFLSDAAEYRLWTRDVTADGNTWTFLDNGDRRKFGLDGSVYFNDNLQVTEFGQFVLSKPYPNAQAVPSDRDLETSEGQVHTRVYPNPAPADGQVRVETSQTEQCTFRLFDAQGRAVQVVPFTRQVNIQMEGISPGMYSWSVEGISSIRFGKLLLY